MANIFDQFDNDPDFVPQPSKRDMTAPPMTDERIRILMQEWRTTLALPPGPRRDGDLKSLKNELKRLGVSVDAPQSTAAAPMVPVPIQGIDSAGVIRDAGAGRGFINPPLASEIQPAPAAPRGAPRRGSLRALAQGVPGQQMVESPTSQAIESGITSGATAGLDIYARAAARARVTGNSFDQSLAEVRAEQKALQEKYPVITGVGRAAGNIGLAAATGGSSLIPQILAAGAISGTQKYTESAESTLSDAAKAAALGGGLTGAAGGAVRAASAIATRVGATNIIKELDDISKLTNAKEARARLEQLGIFKDSKVKISNPQDTARVWAQSYRDARDVSNFGEIFGSESATKIVDKASAMVKKDPTKENKRFLETAKSIASMVKAEEAGVKAFAKDVASLEFKDILRNQATAGLAGAGVGGSGMLALEFALNRDNPDFDPYSAITSGAILGGTLLPLKLAGAKYGATRYVASPIAQKTVRATKRAIPAAAPVITATMLQDGKIPTGTNPFDQFDNDPDN